MQTEAKSLQGKNLRATDSRTTKTGNAKVNRATTDLSSTRKRWGTRRARWVVKRTRSTTYCERVESERDSLDRRHASTLARASVWREESASSLKWTVPINTCQLERGHSWTSQNYEVLIDCFGKQLKFQLAGHCLSTYIKLWRQCEQHTLVGYRRRNFRPGYCSNQGTIHTCDYTRAYFASVN